MKNKRQIQKENTKTKIAETAYQIYSKYGFSATTVMIAEAAGVSHGTVFVHFPTVNELQIFLIGQFGDGLVLEMHNLTREHDSIEKLLDTYLNIIGKYENFYRHLVGERSLLSEDVQMILMNIQSNIAYHFYVVMEREIKNQTIKNIPAYMLFNTWMGLIHYYLLNQDLFAPEESVLTRYGLELKETFLELISNKTEVI